MTIFSLGSEEEKNPFIRRPISDDGLVGYDQFGQFACGTKLKDGAVSYTFIHDVRLLTCVICGRGWEATGPSMGDQCDWQISSTIVHESCIVRFYGLCQRELYWGALVGARVRFRGLIPIPNCYHGGDGIWAAQPWYTAELIDYPVIFTLGRRKRVHSIEIASQGGTELEWYKNAEAAFVGEDVTKGFSPTKVGLHAWNESKLTEYVKKIVELGGYDKELPGAKGRGG